MTAQKHINAIGKSIVDLEAKAKDLRKAAREIDAAILALHGLLDAAQSDHIEAYGSDDVIVPFTGGTNKPPVDDPNFPIEP